MMNLEKEFNKYVKNFAKKFDYDISNEELKTIYDDFFSNENGVINYFISSKIQDLIAEKQKENIKDNGLEK